MRGPSLSARRIWEVRADHMEPRQAVRRARVLDDALQRVFNILEMSDERRHCQTLTQLEVLHFVGWLPYRTREEFNEYRAEHPDLEPFLPYNFGVLGHASEQEPEDGGGVSRGQSPFVSNLGK